MSKRQQRNDTDLANAVVRGVNILSIRNRSLAQSYMEYKKVPPRVIERVLDAPALRRKPSDEQALSEALTPGPTGPAQE
jgi:hypothetical protein